MRNRLLAIIIAAAAILPFNAVAEDKAKLVTVVTSPDPQTQLMAMVLTMQAAMSAHRPTSCFAAPPATSPCARPPRARQPASRRRT